MDHHSGIEASAESVSGFEPNLSLPVSETSMRTDKLTLVAYDDVNSSSTSSTVTEYSDGRPTSAASVTMTSDVSSVLSTSSKRGPGRPKKDDAEPSTRKLHTRQTKTKRSQEARSGGGETVLGGDSPAIDAAETTVHIKQEQFLSHDISSSSPDLLPASSCGLAVVVIKKEPTCETSAMITDAGDSLSRSSIAADDSMSLEESMISSDLPEKKCALCNRGEKSLLGQGDLKRYEPTAGFNPFKRQLTRAGAKRALSDTDECLSRRGQQHLTWRRARGPVKQQSSEKAGNVPPPPSRSISQPSLDYDNRPLPPTIDELKHVGFVEDIEFSQLFEKTGHVSAHHCCAAWSEGVIQAEDYSLRFVDKAVFSGVSQKCSYCQNFGATINCRYARCTKKYHYPCASGSGCFQDIKTMSLLCPDHTDEAVAIANQEAYCVVCDTPGNISDQLFCTSCGQHYHGNCLDPAVEVNPVVRAGWQCPECKICQTCRQPGDDNKMLVCDTCDKGYHTFCLTPVMTTIPKNGWKCKNCRVCGDCGSRTPGSGPSSRWHLNYSVCDSCYQQRNKGLCCPICGRAYRHFTTGTSKMLLCSQCKRHVHDGCDEAVDLHRTKPEEYVCLACKNRTLIPFDAGSLADSLPSVVDDNGLQDIENFSIFKRLKDEDDLASNVDHDDVDEAIHSSQESLVVTEDSICSMDIDLNALEKGVQQLAGASSPGLLDTNPDGPLAALNVAGEAVSLRETTIHSSTNIRVSRPSGIGMGKPVFMDDDIGKKGGTGRQRTRAAGVGKKKRPISQSSERKRGAKPKLKQLHIGGQNGCSQDQNGKEDDHQQTIVLCSSRDHFTLKQDMCLTCGSYGQGEEGKLIACVQCGHCYHPYCANIKISKIMLQKGWRCLECTVCEGCGKPHDESRLILCDECDISYHIYCLDPPLEEVPTGTWKCKWCIMCVTCGATTPGGSSCQWQNNYSQCAPCSSLEACPVCSVSYCDGELIIQCLNCQRWLHAICDGINTEDEAESAIDFGYHCLLCRPLTGALGPLPPVSPELPASPIPPAAPSPPPVQLVIPQKEPELPKTPKTFFLDGVCLSESGLSQIRGLSMKLTEKKTRPRWRRTPSVQTHTALLLAERGDDEMDTHDLKLAMEANIDGEDRHDIATPQEDWEIHSPTMEKTLLDGTGVLEKKKKARIRVGMGIGGFMPRHRARGGGQWRGGRTMVSSGKPAMDILQSGLMDQDDDMKMDLDGKKLKQRRGRKVEKKKSHMEDNYPLYLQDAFFGRDLLDKCKDSQVDELDLESENDRDFSGGPNATVTSAATTPSFVLGSAKHVFAKAPDAMEITETPVETTSHQLTSAWHETKPDLSVASNLANICPEPVPGDDSDKDHNFDEADLEGVLPGGPLDDLMNLPWDDIANEHTGEPSDLSEHLPDSARAGQEIAGLEDMLNPNQDLPQIDDDDLKFFLKNDPQTNFSLRDAAGFIDQKSASGHVDDGLFPRQDTPSSSISPFSPSLEDFPGLGFGDPTLWPQNPAAPSHFPSVPFPDLQISPSPSAVPGVPDDGDANENLSFNQRNVKKWEVDEPLGEMATISPVLYCNLRHPELKIHYPEWSERAKQISKLWRKVPTEQRVPFLAKARENRATVRSQKSHKDVRRRPRESSAAVTQSSIGNPLTPDLTRQTSIDQSESSNQSSVHMASDDKGKVEADVYTYPPHTPQTPPMQSSPSCGYVQSHHLVFKQPHPPVAMPSGGSFDAFGHPMTPGNSRPGPNEMVSHQAPLHQHLPPTSPAHSAEAFHHQSSNAQMQDQFMHQPVFRPSSTSPVTPGSRPALANVEQGVRQFPMPFHSPNTSSSPRFSDPFGGHIKTSAEQSPGNGQEQYALMPAGGVGNVHQQHSDSYPQYGVTRSPSEQYPRPGMNMRDAYPMNPGMMMDPYGRSHMSSRSSATADPYCRSPMTPSPSDPSLRPSLNQKSMTPEHYAVIAHRDPYSHAPMTPSPVDPYARPPLTPAAADQCARTPLTPVPSDPYARPPMTPAPSDPYARPPMTPIPTDPYARPPATPAPADSYARPPMPSVSADPYARQPMTPAPSDPYARPPMTPAQSDPYARPPMTPAPSDPYARPPMTPAQSDPYARPPMTPAPSDPYARPPMTPAQSDPYARPPRTPAPSDPYARPPMTPGAVEPYVRPPATPVSSDPYARPPMTPRPIVSDTYATSPSSSDPYIRPPSTPRPMMAMEQRPHLLLTPTQPDPYLRPPMTPRPSSSEPCPPHPGISGELYSGPGVGRVSSVVESPDGQKLLGGRSVFSESCSTAQVALSMDEDPMGRHQQSEVQRQQLRELLAKQTKQRQSKKKQEETRQHQKDTISSSNGSQLPLRHWPEETKAGFPAHEGAAKSPMTEFIGTGGPFAGRDMEQMIRPQHMGQIRMSHPGENDPFGQRIMPSGEVVRQTYPGPVRSVGIRSQLPVSMQTHPGMPPPQFAVQHRPLVGYSELPRHEMISEQQLMSQSPQVNATQMGQRSIVPGQEGIPQQPQPGFHPRMLVSQRPVGSPRMQAVGSGQYEGVIVSSGMVVMSQQQQHPQMMVPGGWFPHTDFYRPGSRVRGPISQLPPSGRPMYPMNMCGPPPPQLQQSLQGYGQSHMAVMNAAVPSVTGPVTLGQPMGSSGVPLPRVGVEDSIDKSDADQFEDLIGAGDNFDILEYADPELDNTLSEHHDKSIFDEHLGIHKPNSGAGTSSPSVVLPTASSVLAQACISQSGTLSTAPSIGSVSSSSLPGSVLGASTGVEPLMNPISATIPLTSSLPSGYPTLTHMTGIKQPLIQSGLTSTGQSCALPTMGHSGALSDTNQSVTTASPAMHHVGVPQSPQHSDTPVAHPLGMLQSTNLTGPVQPVSSVCSPLTQTITLTTTAQPIVTLTGDAASTSSNLMSNKPSAQASATDDTSKSEGSSKLAESLSSIKPPIGSMPGFQAKFLEFSQRTATGTVGGQIEEPDLTGTGGVSKVKKIEPLVTNPSAVKKQSPTGEDPACEPPQNAEGQQATLEARSDNDPVHSLPQVDGCFDCSTDDSYDSDDDEDLCDYYNFISGRKRDSINYELSICSGVEFVDEDTLDSDDPELVHIWHTANVALQVDGAADDEVIDAEKETGRETNTTDAATNAVSSVNLPSAASNVDEVISDTALVMDVTLVETARESDSVTTDEVIPSASTSEPVSTAIECSFSGYDESCVETPDKVTQSINLHRSLESECLTVGVQPEPMEGIASASVVLPAQPEENAVMLSVSMHPQPMEVTPLSQQPIEVTEFSSMSVPPDVANLDAFSSMVPQSSVPIIDSSRQPALTSSSDALVEVADKMIEDSKETENLLPRSTEEPVEESQIEPLVPTFQLSTVENQTQLDVVQLSEAVVIKPCASLDSFEPTSLATGLVIETTEPVNTQSSIAETSMDVGSECSTQVEQPGSSVESEIQSSQKAPDEKVQSIDGDVPTTNEIELPVTTTSLSVVPTSSCDSETMSVAVTDVQNFNIDRSTALVPVAVTADVVMSASPGVSLALTTEIKQQFRLGLPVSSQPLHRGLSTLQSSSAVPRQMYFMTRHQVVPPGSEPMAFHTGQPQGPPPPYPNKQYVGQPHQQQFWSRRMHGPPGDWMRHPHPNQGSNQPECIRYSMIPPNDWSVQQQPHPDWQYVMQTPQSQSQQHPDWTYSQSASTMSGYVPHSVAISSSSVEQTHSGYQQVVHNVHAPSGMPTGTENSPTSHQGSQLPSRPLHSPQQSSPASGRLEHHDMASPRSSHSRTPHNLSQPGTPQALQPGAQSTDCNSMMLPSSVSSNSIIGDVPVSTMAGESPVPRVSSATVVQSESQAIPLGDVRQHAAYAVVSSNDPNIGYGMQTRPEMLQNHPGIIHRMYVPSPAGNRFVGPPHSMYLPGSHPGGPTMFRMPNSSTSAHSAIGALLSPQRQPISMPVQYVQRAGPAGVEQRYQLMPPTSQDGYAHLSPRPGFPGTIMMPGRPGSSSINNSAIQSSHRGITPLTHSDSAGGQQAGQDFSGLPSSMQSQLPPHTMVRMHLGQSHMRVGVPAPSQMMMRPVPPNAGMQFSAQGLQPSQMRVMVSNSDMQHTPQQQQQQHQMSQSEPPLFPDQAGIYRSKLVGEQPLLLEDLLEQEKQEQRRNAEHQHGQGHQQISSQSVGQSGSQASQLPSTAPGNTASSTAESGGLSSSLNMSADTSAILTDADVDKLNVDVLSEDFRKQMPMTMPDENQIHQQQQPQQHVGSYEHLIRPVHPDQHWIPRDGVPTLHGGYPPRLVVPQQMGARGPPPPPQSFLPGPSTGVMPGYQPGNAMGIAGGLPVEAVGVAFTSPPPLKPQDPPQGEPQTEEEHQIRAKFDEWLHQMESWLQTNIHLLEQQVNKFRRTKKALNAKQRVARKNGNELSDNDAQILAATCQDQSYLQKQLDQLRKQHRTHRGLMNDGQTKQPERFTSQSPDVPPFVGHLLNPQMPMSGMVVKPPSNSVATPRAPGAMQPVRLTPQARQEYEEYVRNRLNIGQSGPCGIVTSVGALGPPVQQTILTTITQGDENNPFSESYQQRERMEKLQRMQQQQQQHIEQQQRPMDHSIIDRPSIPGVFFDKQGQSQPQRPCLPAEIVHRYPGPHSSGPQMLFTGDGSMPLQQASVNGPVMRHVIASQQVPAASVGTMTGPNNAAMNVLTDTRIITSTASAQQIHQGGILPSQQTDGSTAYVLSPARCTSSTPNSVNPQTYRNSPSTAHLPTGDTSSRTFHGEFSVGNVLAVPLPIDAKDQISNLPSSGAFAEIETAQAAPKKKRRRRKKAEAATEDAAAVPSCGATMSSGSDLELNPSMFMSQFPGCNLPLVSPGAGSLRMIKPDNMPVGFLPSAGPGSIRLPPGHVLQIQERSPCPMPREGRGMSDLQTFVNRVRPQQVFSPETSSLPVASQAGQHHFSPGHKRPMYNTVEQSFGPGQFIPSEVMMKVNNRSELAEEQPTGGTEREKHGLAEDIDGKSLNNNAVLKKLLNTNKSHEQFTASATSGSLNRLSEDEENIQLTPEQQRQLELIESMPFTVAKEQEDVDPQCSEDRESIIELRRQEFERRRKELAEQQPKVVRPRQRRTIKQEAGAPAASVGDGSDRTPKKRQKKQSQQTAVGPSSVPAGSTIGPSPAAKTVERSSSGVDYTSMAEQLLQQLQQLPVVSLQEPEVQINYAVWLMLGTSVFSDGHANAVTTLTGNYGSTVSHDSLDYYNSPPFASKVVGIDASDSKTKGAVPPASSEQSGIEGRSTVDQLKDQETKVRASSIDSLPSQGINLVTSIMKDQQLRCSNVITDSIKLPSPPLIEPHYEALSRMSDQSPLSVVSSSSPEPSIEPPLDMKNPWLHLIPDSVKCKNVCASPEIGVVCPKPVKAMKAFDSESNRISLDKTKCTSFSIDMNGRGFKPHVPGGPEHDNNQVSVMLTLSASAAENIGGVLAAIADLLRIAVPPSYEISRSPSPPMYTSSADIYRFGFVPGVKHKEEAINIQALMKSRSKFCHVCSDVVTEDANRPRKADLFSLTKDEQVMCDDEFSEVVFCSEKCRKQFGVMESPVAPPPQQPISVVTDHTVTSSIASDISSIEIATHKEEVELELAPPSTNLPSDSESMVSQQKPIKLSICLGPEQNAVTIVSGPSLTSSKNKRMLKHKSVDSIDEDKNCIKRPKEIRFKRWVASLVKAEKISKVATEKELYEILDRLSPVIRPKAKIEDSRKCALCHTFGDAPSNGPGRLLNVDADKWVHLNCALWSNEVYETMNGALMYVEVACKRGTSSDCMRCKKPGATIGCFRPRCPSVYHIACAQQENVTFYQDKSVLCAAHTSKTPDLDSQQLSSVAVFRRVYVNRDEHIQVARIMRSEDKKCAVRLGGLIIYNIGQLLPYQIHSGCFHSADCIYPVGYKAVRYYWSYRQINKRCRYICKIEDVNGRPQFVVTAIERGMEQAVIKESSCSEIARQIMEPLEKMRRENDLVKVFPSFLTGEDFFGLTDPSILKIIESLPGVEMLSCYHFRYGRSSLYKLPLAVNPSGCARSEPRMKAHFKKPHTLHGAGNCRSLPSTVTVMPGDVNSPYLKQFVHSKSQQYRRLKTEWRNNIYLRRSNVQGLGLFAARDLEKHTMVIEYIGQLIRNEVAEMREKVYEKQNHGVYMFRISDSFVVDATMSGGLARYINHSCHPNCVAEVVHFEKESKIIIITKRKIAQGEELAYDYKFDFEDDQHKIPCLCGAPNCRKWMN